MPKYLVIFKKDCLINPKDIVIEGLNLDSALLENINISFIPTSNPLYYIKRIISYTKELEE